MAVLSVREVQQGESVSGPVRVYFDMVRVRAVRLSDEYRTCTLNRWIWDDMSSD